MVKQEVSNSDIDKQQSKEEIRRAEKEEAKRLDDIKLQKELEENSKPLKLTQAFVNRPFIVLLICGIIFLICTIVTGAAGLGEMSKENDRDFLIWSDERTEHFDILSQAQEDFQKSLIDSEVPVRSIPETRWSTFLVLQDENDGNLLSPKGIKFIYKMEQKIKNLKNYENFCIATTESTECADNVLYSITTLFDNPDSVSQSEIDDVVDDIINDDVMWITYKGLFSSEFSKDNKKTSLIRSMFTFGGPLDIDGKRYKDIFDDEETQSEKFDEFSQDILDVCNDEDLDKPDGYEIMPYSQDLLNVEMGNVANKDLMWAIGSIVFVLIYLGIHLKSAFLSSMSMLSILFSFPITLVIFGLVFQIDYFSSLHILVVFIVLGIAADNVFVFTDAWNQTAFYKQLEGDLNKRMAVTFRRASKAMLATSSTTGAAFLATGFSPIMPISSFGFFAGILIPVNFILVITFYPAVLIVYTKYTKDMCKRKNKKYQNKEQSSPRQVSNSNDEIQKNENNKDVIQEKQEEGRIERFFENQFNTFVYKGRFVILALFSIWTAIAIWRTTQLPSLSEPEQFLPDDHPSQKASNLMRYDFHQSGNSDTGIKVYHMFGVKDIDKDGVGAWDSTDLGKVVYDNDFTLSPKQNQQYIYDVCKKMEESDIVQDGLVNCFMVDFKSFVESKGLEFPVDEDDFIDNLKEFTENSEFNGASYYNENQIGLMKGELKYVVIELSSVGIPFSPHKELNPTFEKWDDYVKETNKNAPSGLKHSIQTAKIGWCFMITEKAFSSSAVQGTLISLAFAFLVLILTTHNIITATFSILSICGIVVSVISIMEMAGWELGVAESVAIVILIGMSVDYVVHLATHYVESSYTDRYRKMQISLKDLGISIISGASTTIGSGIFLFFATMTLFTKFAILICGTILFSLIYALVFFSALNHVAGPQKDQGNLRALFRKNKKQEDKQKESQKQQQQPQDLEAQQN